MNPSGEVWRVLWTRGAGCREMAVSLGEALAVSGDLGVACARHRADLLVARKLTSFSLVSTVVPHGFDPDVVTDVVAAVGGGPHSMLAGRVAAQLVESLGVPGSLVSASPAPEDDAVAEAVLQEVGDALPGLALKVVRAESARHLVDGMPEGSLLVVGAPGGSWFQRQFFGPGRQLVVRAPAGAVVVRRAPRRCFHAMDDPVAFGPQMPVSEALRLLEDDSAPVVEEGRLIGIVRRSVLESNARGEVGMVMEDPVFVREDDALDATSEIAGFVSPIPVVDGEGRLRGVIRP